MSLSFSPPVSFDPAALNAAYSVLPVSVPATSAANPAPPLTNWAGADVFSPALEGPPLTPPATPSMAEVGTMPALPKAAGSSSKAQTMQAVMENIRPAFSLSVEPRFFDGVNVVANKVKMTILPDRQQTDLPTMMAGLIEAAKALATPYVVPGSSAAMANQGADKAANASRETPQAIALPPGPAGWLPASSMQAGPDLAANAASPFAPQFSLAAQ